MSRRAAGGFTLLELVLAMAVLSVLALTLSASLHIAFKARNSAQAAVEMPRTAGIALDLLGRDLGNALPPTGLLAGPFLGMSGLDAGDGENLLEFYCLANEAYATDPKAGGIGKVDLVLLGQADGTKALVRRLTRNLLSPQAVEPQEEILCRRVKSVALRYDLDGQWQETWDSTTLGDVLPRAVEITVEIDAEDGKSSYRAMRIVSLPMAHEADAQTGGVP